MHPLAPDFDDMTDEKLDEKIKTLNSRIVSAYRSGSQAVGQMAYQQAAEEQAQQQPSDNEQEVDDDNVVDVDYEEVEEEK